MSKQTTTVRTVEALGKQRWRVTFGPWMGQDVVRITCEVQARTNQAARKKALEAMAAREGARR
jgi:hypothetical protein